MTDTIPGNPSCDLCVLNRAANFVCLMGNGAIPAKVMVVGEAPGQKEDQVGKPFQGPSGKLLDKLLEKAGLSRDRVYITNAVKCRPPDNRTPRPKELKACRPYLVDELEQVKPKFVIVLGAAAVKQTLGGLKITEVHGSVILRDGVTYLPAFHPAAALRDPKRMGPLEMDFKKFGEVISGKFTVKNRVEVRVARNDQDLADLELELMRAHRISFDIETDRLNYKEPGGKINCIGFTTDSGSWSAPLESDDSPWRDRPDKKMYWRRKEILHALVRAIQSNPPAFRIKKRISAQNGKFDNNWLFEKYEIRVPLNYDTMLAFHLIDENQPSGLKYRSRLHCNAPDYDISDKDKLGNGDLAKLYQYNGEDCHYTRELEKISSGMLREQDGLWDLFRMLVMPVARAYEQIEMNGVYLDRNLLVSTMGPMKEEIISCQKQLQKMSGTRRLVNWNSPTQVNDIFFDRLGLEPRGYTPTGAPSTAEGHLLAMKNDHPIVETLLRQRKYQKLVSTYLEGWLSRMHGDYLYPKFKTNGTITGRPSCEDPNIQATPREKLVRQLITAPPGWIFFESDYSQIELRVAAMLSGDRELMRIYQTGGDVHRATAALITGKRPEDVTDEERKMAKAVNFGFLYGMGWKKFMDYAFEKYDVIVSERESRNFRKRFFENFDGLEPWHDRQRRIVSAMGQVRTLTGRIRHLPEIHSPDRMLASQAERDAINSPVQGFAAELTLMAVIAINDKLPPDKIKLCGTVHDAIIGRVRADVAHEMMHQVKEIMERPPLMDQLGIRLSIPIEVEVKLGPWGMGKKVSF